MRSVNKVHWSKQMLFGALFMVMVLGVGLTNSFVSHAESKGQITASSSVNIRQEASANSTAIGSAERGATVDIKGQVTASDGTTWYQVYVNGTTLGYIRADLVKITDGTTPPAVTAGSTTTTTTPDTTTTMPTTTTDGVTAVEPISATVTNSKSVRVRAGASTTSEIVTTAQNGLALTVTGQTMGEDNKVWYQVNFIADGTEVVGFIRSDFVSLSGELVPVTEETPVTEPTVEEETPVVEEPEVVKEWDTQLEDTEWYLLNTEKNEKVNITELLEGVARNKELYEDGLKTIKSQKIVIVILVLVALASAAVAAMLFLKLKDIKDKEYFSQVADETMRSRSANKSHGGQRVMHTVGSEKNPASKPQGTKPAGAQGQTVRPQGAQAQGTRPAGAQGQVVRPQGGQSQGTRPAGTQGQTVRPQGGQPQTTRSAGTQGQVVRPQGGQPQTTRSAGTQGQTVRPQGGQPQATRPAGTQQAAPEGSPVSQRPQTRPVENQGTTAQNQGWQSKNFMTDDDEFEFEFLNWDGNEDK